MIGEKPGDSTSLMPRTNDGATVWSRYSEPPLPPATLSLTLPTVNCAWYVSVSKATMLFCCATGSALVACAWPSVASFDWLARLGSRPSHITVVKNDVFADGSGRRYMRSVCVVRGSPAQCSGSL